MIKPLDECMKEAEQALNDLIDYAGTIAHLSRMLTETKLGVFTPQMIGGWIHRGRISKRGAVAVISHMHFNTFTLAQLRPDVEERVWNELLDEAKLLSSGQNNA